MTLRVAFIARNGPAEEAAAWSWLQGEEGLEARRYEPRELGAAVARSDAVWVHASVPLGELAAEPLRTFAAAGHQVLLTLRAAALVTALGLESAPPNDIGDGRWDDDADPWYQGAFRALKAYPHVRGLATYGPHPLVAGLHNGTYTWAPAAGEAYTWACYAGGVRPAEGRVVAVERAFALQNADRIVAWEYALGRGHVVCVGAFVHFAAQDPRLRAQLGRLVRNALAAGAAESTERAYWPEPGTIAAPSEALVLPEPLDLDGALPDPATDPIALESAVEADEGFDLAGRRALLVGGDRLGIREVWIHPHRAVAAWDVAVDGEPATGTRITVTPDVAVRTLETPRHRISETTFVALEHPIVLVEYHAARKGRASVGRSAAGVEITLRLDLRRTWPFPAGCGGNLRFRRSAQGLVAVVESESDDGVAVLFAGGPAAIQMKALHVEGVPVVECTVTAPLGGPFRLAIAGGASRAEFERSLRAVRRLGVAGLVRQRAQRATTVREARLSVVAEDDHLGRAVEWAKRRLDAFVVDAPGVGRSLAAGYASSRPGWGAGRPGHAWFVTRDACWSALALLAAGEHSVVRQVIRFLGDRQDVTGKVLHEASTSGQFHYDAADATPLYLLLVARYLAWTGDAEFVGSIWPHVERAFAFCLSTDTDGDGLIENAGVGHGWIESGPLGGADVTLALAAIWRSALEDLAHAAEVLGKARFAADCWARAARAGTAIERDLFREQDGRYALDRQRDGSVSWSLTAMASLPLLLGAANPVRARGWFDALAGARFTTGWGVRLLPSDDPHFDPAGAYAGTVWPLVTGWSALAEYRAGWGEAGGRHLAANVGLAFARQGGVFDEALNGLAERAAGVCPDQAASAAMVLAPLVEGLLGVRPDAPGGRMTIAPQLPGTWDPLIVRGLRCGETVYDLRLRRRKGVLDIGVRRRVGPPLWITVAPWLRAPPKETLVDAQAVKADVSAWGAGVRAAVSFQASGEHDARFEEEA